VCAVVSARAATASAEETAPSASDFAPVVSAWEARSASAVRRLIPEGRRLSIDLVGAGDGRVSGQPTRENAEAVLKEYFGLLDSASLRDPAPDEGRGWTRVYDYTYRPTGAEARTTRLSISLAALRGGGYGLVAVVEREKRG
jgi:hypothetical protein